MSILLQTERLRFRELADDDLPVLTEMFADPEVMRYALGGTRDEEQTRIWLHEHRQRFPAPPWGFRAAIRKDTGAYAGHIGLLRQEVEGEELCEVAYWLQRAHWGHGFATEGARAFRDLAFTELEFDRVISLIHPENLASQAVARRNGMQLERVVAWREMPEVLQYGIRREVWARKREDR